MVRETLFDQLTPVALYGKIRELFPSEITMLFEIGLIMEMETSHLSQ